MYEWLFFIIAVTVSLAVNQLSRQQILNRPL